MEKRTIAGMKRGERQVAPTLAGIRRDHVARYEWAARQLAAGSSVVDVACGVGYGAKLLADAGHRVTAVDRDRAALAYGRKHYAHSQVRFVRADVRRLKLAGRQDVAVCFEAIEHLADPLPMLKRLRDASDQLLASVPNEDELPWRGYAFHYRHYTPGQFRHLLEAAGWEVTEWWSQADEKAEPVRDTEDSAPGRTLIAVARRRVPPKQVDLTCDAARILPAKIPEHVAILGLGPSVRQYLELTRRQGGRWHLFDEVWTINALGDVIECDRVFHMDDVRIQEIRAAEAPKSNIAMMLQWLKRHPGPVYTSRPHPDYPGLVPYPLEAVVNNGRFAYMNSTAAHAVAFAVYLGVKKITLYGMDFTYPDSHHAEKGRACVEFWLGIAAARGIRLAMPKTSSLMDACLPDADKLYGYDTLDVHIEPPVREGRLNSMRFTEKQGPLPTAAEIERRYDHSRHPSPLLEKA